MAERYADADASIHELLAARAKMRPTPISEVLVHSASMMVTHAAEWAMRGANLCGDVDTERSVQADLLRCIFGNPFRPVALDPAWRTDAVVGLASSIYADRAFDRLPALAATLEHAGCADADVLGHCRGPGPHARGCWVVDLLLGKT